MLAFQWQDNNICRTTGEIEFGYHAKILMLKRYYHFGIFGTVDRVLESCFISLFPYFYRRATSIRQLNVQEYCSIRRVYRNSFLTIVLCRGIQILYINIIYIYKINRYKNYKETKRSKSKVQRNNIFEGNMPSNLLADWLSPQGIIRPQVLNLCLRIIENKPPMFDRQPPQYICL